MLPSLYCINLLCVSLIYDTNSVIYEMLETKAEVDYQNEQNRNNFLMLETDVEYNFDTRVNKVATEVVTSVTNHVLHNITNMVQMQFKKDTKHSPCMRKAANFIRTEAITVVRGMLPCVTIVHEKYFNFTEEIQFALKGYSENKLALRKLSDMCNTKANNIKCYTKPLYKIQKSVAMYSAMFKHLATQVEDVLFDRLPIAETCIKNFLPQLDAMGATAIEDTRECLKEKAKPK
ncbi:hypothetical protein KM043_018616 [Ampulex compressa]|uniref:Venom protein n=1 Tax=Ampulex compressa TaxID=860918 RepID=A0A1W6EVX0_AMPCP|nr:venom protein [Ampulex compressa]KAG7202282.1 hypothetical protein KM043_018616 [Ampulex compressa]